MSGETAIVGQQQGSAPTVKDAEFYAQNRQFVTMEVGGQLFGIPVEMVQDILRPQRITSVPLARHDIIGAINLRGRIVTVIDMNIRMGISSENVTSKRMQVVITLDDELYSLVVDGVGEVMSLPNNDFEQSPSNLAESWREVSLGVYRLKDQLMVVLDTERLLNIR